MVRASTRSQGGDPCLESVNDPGCHWEVGGEQQFSDSMPLNRSPHRVLSTRAAQFCRDPCVGEGGLEPPHPFGHRNLNPARLPIPPLARATGEDYLTVYPLYRSRAPGRLGPSMGLQKFEGRLERLVDGTFSKAFRGELHPVEIGRRLTREMDLQRRLGVHGLIAPNAFGVRLATDDFERFESFLEALIRELEEAAREHARNENYVFVGPVTVTVYEDRRLRRGRFNVVSEFKEGPSGLAGGVIGPGRGRTYRHRGRDRDHRAPAREHGGAVGPQRQSPPRRGPAAGQ